MYCVWRSVTLPSGPGARITARPVVYPISPAPITSPWVGVHVNVGPPGAKKSTGALEEARALVWIHRRRLAVGLILMVINRLSGLVLPTTTKYLMDDVFTKGRWDILPLLASAAGIAMVVDAGTSFANSQILG